MTAEAIISACQCGKPGCDCLRARVGHENVHCPAHVDVDPSLSVGEKYGKPLVYCHGGCAQEAVISALRELGLWESKSSPLNRRDWTAYDASTGRFRSSHIRIDKADGTKDLFWEPRGVKTKDLAMYRADVLAQKPGVPVVVCEGEPATDALATIEEILGIVSVGTITGASTQPGESALSVLVGRRVYLWPDADPPGAKHMQRLASRLQQMGCKELLIVSWKQAPKHGDAVDAIAEGVDVAGLLIDAETWKPGNVDSVLPNATEGFHLTDLGNANRLATRHTDELRFCHGLRKWFMWDGRRWAPDATGTVQALAKETVRGIYQEAADAKDWATTTEVGQWAKKSEAEARIKAMINLACSEPGIPVTQEEMDSNPWLLNCQNGTVDLRTGELTPHDPAQLITKLTPVVYDPDARYGLWDHFLQAVMPDPETRRYVQKIAGISLSGDASEDLIVLVHGPGGTGKGTISAAFMSALGSDYCATADLSTFTTRRDPHAPHPDLARLAGMRLVTISEVEAGGAVTLLKRATGGDRIQTRSHHQETFEFTPQFTLWLMANERPTVPDDDSGIWRRMREIPFTKVFDPPDTGVRQALSDTQLAGPAVLAWAVEGYLAWQREGLGESPPQVAEATEDYRQDMNPLGDFLEERTVAVPGAWASFAQLFTAYRDWAAFNKIPYPLGSKTFTQRLLTRFEKDDRPRNGGRGFRGIGLLETP